MIVAVQLLLIGVFVGLGALCSQLGSPAAALVCNVGASVSSFFAGAAWLKHDLQNDYEELCRMKYRAERERLE